MTAHSSRCGVIRVLRVYDNVAAVCPLFNHLRLSNTHHPLPTIQPYPRHIRDVRDEHTIFTSFRAGRKARNRYLRQPIEREDTAR